MVMTLPLKGSHARNFDFIWMSSESEPNGQQLTANGQKLNDSTIQHLNNSTIKQLNDSTTNSFWLPFL